MLNVLTYITSKSWNIFKKRPVLSINSKNKKQIFGYFGTNFDEEKIFLNTKSGRKESKHIF